MWTVTALVCLPWPRERQTALRCMIMTPVWTQMALPPHSMAACLDSGGARLWATPTLAALAPPTECSDTTPSLVCCKSFNQVCITIVSGVKLLISAVMLIRGFLKCLLTEMVIFLKVAICCLKKHGSYAKMSWHTAMLVRFPFQLRHCIDSQMNTSQLSKFRVRIELGNGGSWVLCCVKLGQQAGGLIQCVGFSAFSQRPYVKHKHVHAHSRAHSTDTPT